MLCFRAAKTETLSREITCPVIQTTTSIYLSQMILMSLSVVTVIIGCCVASTATCTSCCEEQVIKYLHIIYIYAYNLLSNTQEVFLK